MASTTGDSVKVISPIRSRTASEEETIRQLKAGFDLSQTLGGSTESLSHKKTFIVDEDTFVETFLKCLICQEHFDDVHRFPKLLPCHHTLCIVCILQIFKKEAEYRVSLTPAYSELPTAVTIVCPTCKNNFISTQEGIRQLPTDHRVIQLRDFVRLTERYIVDFCPKHKLQALNFFCETCCAYVCRDCTIIDHKEIRGHRVLDPESASKRYKPIIDKVISEMSSEKVSLQERKLAIEKALESMETEEEKVVEKIREAFGKLREILNEREKEVIETANLQTDAEKRKLKEKVDHIDKRCDAIDDKMQSLEKVKEEGKMEDLYRTSQNVRNYRPEPIERVRELDEGLVTKISFSDRDQDYIVKKIENFGDVLSQVESVYEKSSTRGSSTSSYSDSRYSSSRYSSTPESRYGGSSESRYGSSESRYGSSESRYGSSESRYSTNSSSRYSSPYNRYSSYK